MPSTSAPSTSRASGQESWIEAAAVLGCDGAGSLTRAAMGSSWRELGPAQPWLVVDVRCRLPLDVWDGVQQVCDPVRAATCVRVGDDRYRWEFQLRPGERVQDLDTPEALRGLLAPWTAGVPADELVLLRHAGYTFRACVATSWGQGV